MKHFCYLVLVFVGVSASPNVSGQAHASTERICAKVAEIKQIPRERDEKGVDAAYDEIRAAGTALIPCLIDQITNTTITHDPRCPHITEETKIGDVSYFLLVDLLKIEFTRFFPADVKDKFKTDGVYAYHEYIETKGARADLQKKLRDFWLASKKEKT